MTRVEIFTRQGCHLCDEAKKVLREVGRRLAFELIERDIDTDPAWRAAYGSDVPVICIDGRKAFKHRMSVTELERRLKR